MSRVAMRTSATRATAVPVPQDARRPAPTLAEQRAERRRGRGPFAPRQIVRGA